MPESTCHLNTAASDCRLGSDDVWCLAITREDLICQTSNIIKAKNRMKRIIRLLFIAAFIASSVHGCAGKLGLPQGATKTAEYRGSFDGYKTYGTLAISVFRLPDGSLICKGWFRTTPNQLIWNISGSVLENQVQAGFQSGMTGQLTGTLSPDATTMSGKFEMTYPTTDHGSWEANK